MIPEIRDYQQVYQMCQPPNRLDDPQYILRLIAHVMTVSVQTVEMVNRLASVISPNDWLGESVDVGEESLSAD